MYYFIKSFLKKFLSREIINFIRASKYFFKSFPYKSLYISFIKNKFGLEIGGPSIIFRGFIPIYSNASLIDFVNFSGETIWEGNITTNQPINYYENKLGKQYILDAVNLNGIESNSYDFLISSNCLEHIANPIKGLFEWRRVIKNNGILILVLPNKKFNFDNRRIDTKFDHILSDYLNNTGENDLTHLDEIISLHDLELDPEAGNINEFHSRSLMNFENRTLHHHVFNIDLITQVLEYCNFKVIHQCESDVNYYTLAQKII